MDKNKAASSRSDQVRTKIRLVGVISIVLIVVFFILLFIGVLSFIEWLILVLVTWVAANLGLRRIKRTIRP